MKKETKYIRLLSYENACKVDKFICNNLGIDDFAWIQPGGVAIQVTDENYEKFLNFINSLGVRYEISGTSPHQTKELVIQYLKDKQII